MTASRYIDGRPAGDGEIEDFAYAQLEMPDGESVRVACSWWVPTGGDALIGAVVHGSDGTAEVRNVGGSFYDFRADLHTRGSTRALARPPDDWGGRRLIGWAGGVGRGAGYDPEVESILRVARVVDRIYGRQR